MKQHRNERARETGDPRDNPPTSGIVRHNSHLQKSKVNRSGIEPGSPWCGQHRKRQWPNPRSIEEEEEEETVVVWPSSRILVKLRERLRGAVLGTQTTALVESRTARAGRGPGGKIPQAPAVTCCESVSAFIGSPAPPNIHGRVRVAAAGKPSPATRHEYFSRRLLPDGPCQCRVRARMRRAPSALLMRRGAVGSPARENRQPFVSFVSLSKALLSNSSTCGKFPPTICAKVTLATKSGLTAIRPHVSRPSVRRGKREILDKTRRPVASSGTIPTCEIREERRRRQSHTAARLWSKRLPVETWILDEPELRRGSDTKGSPAMCGDWPAVIWVQGRRPRLSTGERTMSPLPAPHHDTTHMNILALRVAPYCRRRRKKCAPAQNAAHLCVQTIGDTVAERLACSPPTKSIRVQSPAGSLRIFACENRAGRCRWSAGFLGDLPFPPPLHSSAAPYSPQSPSWALKTSIRNTRTLKVFSWLIIVTKDNKTACPNSSSLVPRIQQVLPHGQEIVPHIALCAGSICQYNATSHVYSHRDPEAGFTCTPITPNRQSGKLEKPIRSRPRFPRESRKSRASGCVMIVQYVGFVQASSRQGLEQIVIMAADIRRDSRTTLRLVSSFLHQLHSSCMPHTTSLHYLITEKSFAITFIRPTSRGGVGWRATGMECGRVWVRIPGKARVLV
ncbi:hypothetical protein PR048_006506 [Dryococelus australis]|uniref:Uncharacterized protein n=1 Tax=Dryococelus australis TaxID=614101 RepID=A0ABQ9ICG9_9NEOP|nr:hypothetical protein PR048_006506 [Dryococelus australis]